MEATGKNHGLEFDVAAVAAAGGFHFHNPHCPLCCHIELQIVIFTCGPIKYHRLCCSATYSLTCPPNSPCSYQRLVVPVANWHCWVILQWLGGGELADVNWQWIDSDKLVAMAIPSYPRPENHTYWSLEVAHEQGHWAAVPSFWKSLPWGDNESFLVNILEDSGNCSLPVNLNWRVWLNWRHLSGGRVQHAEWHDIWVVMFYGITNII